MRVLEASRRASEERGCWLSGASPTTQRSLAKSWAGLGRFHTMCCERTQTAVQFLMKEAGSRCEQATISAPLAFGDGNGG